MTKILNGNRPCIYFLFTISRKYASVPILGKPEIIRNKIFTTPRRENMVYHHKTHPPHL